MPGASVEIHFRDEIERLLRADVGEEIIDALALFHGPLKKADDCVSALPLFRELPARGSHLRLIADIGVIRNNNLSAPPCHELVFRLCAVYVVASTGRG